MGGMALKKRKPFKNQHVASSYRPTSTVQMGYGYGSNVLDGKPFFFPDVDVPRMMFDPLVQFGIRLLISPLRKAKITVKCDNAEAGAFIDATVKKFWAESMPTIADDYFTWGYAAYLPAYKNEGGMEKFVGGRPVSPKDAMPHVYKEGEKGGQFAGFQLNGTNDSDGTTVVKPPFAFWFGGQEKRGGRLYDHSRLKFAFDPWTEKETRGGIKDRRRLYHVKLGIPTTVVYHPTGFLDPTDPNSEKNKDIANEIATKIASGAVITMPDTRTPDDKGEPRWRVEVLETAKPGFDFEEVMDYEDKMILLGLGIPREIFEAADTGSGYSGRAIPMDTFLGMSDQIVGLLVKAMDHCIIRHLIDQNFGPDVKYELEVAPLAQSVAGQEGQPGQDPMAALAGGDPSMAATGGQPGAAPELTGGQPAAAPDQGGGGDPTAGGFVPYLGKRGGKGKKDPKTGRVYYNLSHDGQNYGCLLAPLHGSMREAMLSFARSIPVNELHADGIEEEPHLTLRYGLHTDDGKAVLNAVSRLGSLRFRPGPLQVFPGDGCDILYVSCGNDRDPKRWWETAGAFPNTPTHDDYVPHMTVAYLKKGKGAQYVGRDIAGECQFPCVEYHPPAGECCTADIWPTADELLDMLGSDEPVNMATWVRVDNPEYATYPFHALDKETGRTAHGPDAEAALKQKSDDSPPPDEDGGSAKPPPDGPKPKPKKPAPKPTSTVQPPGVDSKAGPSSPPKAETPSIPEPPTQSAETDSASAGKSGPTTVADEGPKESYFGDGPPTKRDKIAHDELKEMFGRPVSKADVIALAMGGHGDQHDVEIGGDYADTDDDGNPTGMMGLSIASRSKSGSHTTRATRMIKRGDDGKLVCENFSFQILGGTKGDGLGTAALTTQIDALRRLGVDRIETTGCGSPGESLNGYYTWPRLGYDGPIPKHKIDEIPAPLRDTMNDKTNIQSLMKTQEGRDWWKANGTGLSLSFDLDPKSESSRTLSAYLEERKQRGGKTSGQATASGSQEGPRVAAKGPPTAGERAGLTPDVQGVGATTGEKQSGGTRADGRGLTAPATKPTPEPTKPAPAPAAPATKTAAPKTAPAPTPKTPVSPIGETKPAPKPTAGSGQVQPLVDQLKRNPPPAQPKPPVAMPVKPPVAKPVSPQPIPQADHAKHTKWASDRIASMTPEIDKLVNKYTGKSLTFKQQSQFGLAAQQAMKDALESGKSEVRIPVKVGSKTLYVVVRRKPKVNLSHLTAPADGWDVSVEE